MPETSETSKRDRFDRSTDALVRAFLRGELRHGRPCACAVGTLVADANNFTHDDRSWRDNAGDLHAALWWSVVLHSRGSTFTPDFQGIEQLRRVPYSIEEISRVESAFEGRHLEVLHEFDDPDSFKGLSDVLDLLMEMDEIETEHPHDVIDLGGPVATVAGATL